MKSVWRASSTGPDWTDIRTFMMEIERTHVCTVYVGMQPIGGKSASDWQVNVVACLPVLDRAGKQVIVGAGGTFPHRDHRTVEGLVYALLARVDWTIGSENYVQERFDN